MINWESLILTLKLAFLTTIILLVIAIPLAYWLSYAKAKIKPIVEVLISMPLILPPTVLGFYLLITFSPSSYLGSWLNQWLGIKLVFSFTGLIFASLVYSLPFMVHPIRSGFSHLPASLKSASYVLGKSRITTLFKVLLPNMKPALLTGIVLSFAHTVGEFGVVLMIGGSIPGETKVASITIYEEVEALNYMAAHTYSLVLFLVSFTLLLTAYLINGGYLKPFWK